MIENPVMLSKLSSISLKARAQRSLIIENTSLYIGGASNAWDRRIEHYRRKLSVLRVSLQGFLYTKSGKLMYQENSGDV